MPVRLAAHDDVGTIVEFDRVARTETYRRELIRRTIAGGLCFVFVEDERVVGYGALEYSFYGNGFIAVLYVHPDHRRRRIGYGLMQHLEAQCKTSKLFTSTNLSNLPMQSLLVTLGYQLSGIIHNLDPGDPELVYCKRVGD